MKILITGSSGFIGYHLSKHLINDGHNVFGLDNHNDYYNVDLKKNRLNKLISQNKSFRFRPICLSSRDDLEMLFSDFHPDLVINLAAQAGVRYGLTNPDSYLQSNLVGFYNILECCKKFNVTKIIYASSSSVYGELGVESFSENMLTDSPRSLYAATKKANELLAHSYHTNHSLDAIGLRFFTVYGPFGRPDMAYYSFSQNIRSKKEIIVFNDGNMQRDMTFIDDIVMGISQSINLIMRENNLYKIYNLGNNQPIHLNNLIKIIEDHYNVKAIIKNKYLNTEVTKTFADISNAKADLGFNPSTSVADGMKKFFDWFDSFSIS